MQETAGDISRRILLDQTKYDAREVGHAMADDIPHQLDVCINNHLMSPGSDNTFPWRDLPMFCVVMQIAEDPLIKTVKRRKFYACPFLPSPRPNQAVFLFTRREGKITKRLWVLPSDMVMAELASLCVVDKRYTTMQAWSIAFFQGTFWEYIRHEHNIDLLSQEEFLLKHRKELIEAGCELFDPNRSHEFDFSKIHIKKVVDPQESLVNQDVFNAAGKA